MKITKISLQFKVFDPQTFQEGIATIEGEVYAQDPARAYTEIKQVWRAILTRDGAKINPNKMRDITHES